MGTSSKVSAAAGSKKAPKDLEASLGLFLSDNQQKLMLDLCSEELGQSHLFEGWSEAEKVSPSVLRQMGNQLESLNESIPGGLRQYILSAKRLLKGTCDYAFSDFYATRLVCRQQWRCMDGTINVCFGGICSHSVLSNVIAISFFVIT